MEAYLSALCGSDAQRIDVLERLVVTDIAFPAVRQHVCDALYSPTDSVRHAALCCWARLGADPVDAVYPSIHHRAPEIRAAAVRALRGWQDERARAAIRHALRDAHADVVRAALDSFVDEPEGFDRSCLVPVMSAADRGNALRAAACLAAIGHADAIVLLREAIHDPLLIQQKIALALVAKHQLAVFVPELRALLRDGGYIVPAVIRVLGVLRDRASLRPILAYLGSGHEPARSAAIQAVVRIGDPVVFAALRGAIRDSRSAVRSAAMVVAVRMGMPLDATEVLSALQDVTEGRARNLLVHWLRGSVETVCDRIVALHEAVPRQDLRFVQHCIRVALSRHPESSAIVAYLHELQQSQCILMLLPYYESGQLPFPAAAALEPHYTDTGLPDVHPFWAFVFAQVRFDPDRMIQFLNAVPLSIAMRYGGFFLDTFDDHQHAIIRRCAVAPLHTAYLQLLAALVDAAPEWIGSLPDATRDWIAAFVPHGDTAEGPCIQRILACWHQQHAATVPPDILRTPTILTALLAVAPVSPAVLVTRFHANPCIHRDTAFRTALRSALQLEHGVTETIARLHNKAHPDIALTLLPLYLSRQLPAPDTALHSAMVQLAGDEADRVAALVVAPADVGFVPISLHEPVVRVTLPHPRAADGVLDVRQAPAQSP